MFVLHKKCLTFVIANATGTLDVLTLFPNARVFYRSAVNAVCFKSNDPDSLCEFGILMPVRHTEESAETESA